MQPTALPEYEAFLFVHLPLDDVTGINKSHMGRLGEREDNSRPPNCDISLAQRTTLRLQPKTLGLIVNIITKYFREELVRQKIKNESRTAQARRGYCSSGPSFFGYSSSVDP